MLKQVENIHLASAKPFSHQPCPSEPTGTEDGGGAATIDCWLPFLKPCPSALIAGVVVGGGYQPPFPSRWAVSPAHKGRG